MREKIKYLIIVFICLSVVSFSGCESVRRKFVRKSKAEQDNPEEVIYAPQEYPVEVMSNEQLYRQYYTLWKGWHQELMEVLSGGQNHKKQVGCITEIVNNLNKMKDLLEPEAQVGLDGYIQKILPIKDEIIAGRSNASNFEFMRSKLESIKSKISKDYISKKIKPNIIK